jgi:hypothetical protein
LLKSQKEKGKSVVISASINILVQNMNERVHQTLNSLNKSAFRSKFRLTQKDRDYLASKGLKTIEDHAFQFINSRVAPDFPRNDGKQTPMKGHPVFVAQHATATCCRGCIQKWHGIEKGKALTEKEIKFLLALIMVWIERQIGGTRIKTR